MRNWANLSQMSLFVLMAMATSFAGITDASDIFHMSVDMKSDVPAVKTDPRPFSLAKHFSDHMVLQRAPARAILHGFSPAVGHKVIAEMTTGSTQKYYTTHVTPSPDGIGGAWSLQLDPMPANVTASFTILSELGALYLRHVIFGDVWICSGQSNMEFTVSQMFGGKEEIANASKYPNIRVMTVAEHTSNTPLFDLEDVLEPWAAASSDSIGGKDWTYLSAVCWLYGKAIHEATGIPIGLLNSNWGGTPDESWSSPDALAQCGLNGSIHGPQNNSVLWNAMIHPLLQLPIYGAIWYQGEADASIPERRNNYNCTFPAMISDWRKKFNAASKGQTSDQFPFGFVQLAPNRPDIPRSPGFADIRWHQTADYGYVPNAKMPNVFMAVALDLPDFNSTFGAVHPRDKKDVGYRLSLGGLSLAYKKSQLFQGPLPTKGESSSQGLVLDYGSTWQLDVREHTGFEINCQSSTNNVWIPTSIVSWNTTTVTVYVGACLPGERPTQLSYGWRESPCDFKQCAVYSKVNNLPGPPFIANLVPDFTGKLTAQFGKPVYI